MPRIARMVIEDAATVYHVMSRTALDGFPLKDVEKDFMLDLIKRLSAFYLAEIFGIRLAIIFRP
jgi:putative transposase